MLLHKNKTDSTRTAERCTPM